SLSALPQGETGTRTAAADDSLMIAVGPVVFPKYLGQPQIVSRTSDHTLDLDEFHRWAEPLEDDFKRTLSKNLSILLSGDRFFVVPWRATTINYRVGLEVMRFDGQVGGDVSLVAIWGILGDDGKKLLLAGKSNFHETTGGGGYVRLVSAQSRLVEALSREVADAILEISKN
ncbi:MAG: membrane integrity-associated transporter subunit PqiC, partial [Deltaproteobacteria bacterium]|nr:membrane integrity-associated transporter subunit PqiC [Deltaproteobacteria bacterium]